MAGGDGVVSVTSSSSSSYHSQSPPLTFTSSWFDFVSIHLKWMKILFIYDIKRAIYWNSSRGRLYHHFLRLHQSFCSGTCDLFSFNSDVIYSFICFMFVWIFVRNGRRKLDLLGEGASGTSRRPHAELCLMPNQNKRATTSVEDHVPMRASGGRWGGVGGVGGVKGSWRSRHTYVIFLLIWFHRYTSDWLLQTASHSLSIIIPSIPTIRQFESQSFGASFY